MTVWHKGGEVSHPQLAPEFTMHDTSAGINISDLGPYYTEIKYFYDCLEQGKEIERAPLSEGIKSVLLGLEELKAAKKYLEENRRRA